MAGPRGRGWVGPATAAALLAAGCADEPPPRKDRPADRAGEQYAAERLDPRGAETIRLAAVRENRVPTRRGDMQR